MRPFLGWPDSFLLLQPQKKSSPVIIPLTQYHFHQVLLIKAIQRPVQVQVGKIGAILGWRDWQGHPVRRHASRDKGLAEVILQFIFRKIETNMLLDISFIRLFIHSFNKHLPSAYSVTEYHVRVWIKEQARRQNEFLIVQFVKI